MLGKLCNKYINHCFICAMLTILPASTMAGTDEDVHFTDIATELIYGIDYARTRSIRDDIYQEIRNDPSPAGGVFQRVPTKSRGIPGVAIFDFDNDGDMDIYATNGPGTHNSLYSNQMMETGQLTFIDVGEISGAGAQAQDSSGVCFGDIDNDGDQDLYVLGTGEPNILFQNSGDGTFTDITEHARVAAGSLWSSSATMGDVNGDGLLDIYVGNIGNLNSSEVLFTEPFKWNEHNQLFLNRGNNIFSDVSETSGIMNLTGLAAENAGQAGPTHAVGMVDYDLDGDIDIFSADDQAGILPLKYGGVDRGLIHIFQNDGSGHFTDVNVEQNTSHAGAWMGLSFGDFNHDGHMDFFASNMGLYNGAPPELMERNLDQNASRWYLGGENGFTRPPLNNVNATPFGWGTSVTDYDNDGDSDILFYGSLDLVGMIILSNPGVILRNDGAANFEYDRAAMLTSTDHVRRVVHGVAVGDLNNDGFNDIVSASNFNIPESVPLETFEDLGGAFDGISSFVPTFGQFGDPPSFRYDPNLPDFPNGTLSVEMNSGNSNNSSSSSNNNNRSSCSSSNNFYFSSSNSNNNSCRLTVIIVKYSR